MGELNLIKHFRAGAPTHPWIKVGPGSDCAVLAWPGQHEIAFKIDQVIEGSHFVLSGPEAATPYQAGWKAMAKACSDIAAAGGWPVATTVALNLRKGSNEALALGVYDGLVACCQRFAIGLAGGDFATSENGLCITVSLLGTCPANLAWTRSGAKLGDVLFVTGSLGASRLGKHLNFVPRLDEARRIREIAPNGVHACIDVTDGLSRDLKHICAESHCGAELCAELVPLSTGATLQNALSDGEDFELLLAVEPTAAQKLLQNWNLKTPLTRIGAITASDAGMVLVDIHEGRTPLLDTGFEHHV